MMSEKCRVPEGYKKTKLDVIPEEWEVEELGNVCNFFDHMRVPIKKEDRMKRLGPYPYYGAQSIIDWIDDYIFDGNYLLIAEDGENLKSKVLPIAYQVSGKFWVNNHAHIIKPNDNYKIGYLEYILNFTDIEKYITGSAQPKLNQNTAKKIKIPIPTVPEQQKIASILSKVDEQIEQTEQIIEKTELLKKGLMQKLLIKGIGHTRFQNTELGEIPEEWKVAKLEDCCNKITDGSHYSPKSVENSDYKIATIANINNNEFDLKSCKKISADEYEKLVKNGCKPDIGDVLFSKDGTVGLCLVHRQEVNLVLLSSIAIISLKIKTLDSNFCAHILKSDLILNEIIGRKTGTAIRRVVLRDLKTVKIPLPPIPEQQKIASILSKVDSQIQDNQNYLTKLQELKRGLMQDLLTGKVRVTV